MTQPRFNIKNERVNCYSALKKLPIIYINIKPYTGCDERAVATYNITNYFNPRTLHGVRLQIKSNC